MAPRSPGPARRIVEDEARPAKPDRFPDSSIYHDPIKAAKGLRPADRPASGDERAAPPSPFETPTPDAASESGAFFREGPEGCDLHDPIIWPAA